MPAARQWTSAINKKGDVSQIEDTGLILKPTQVKGVISPP